MPVIGAGRMAPNGPACADAAFASASAASARTKIAAAKAMQRISRVLAPLLHGQFTAIRLAKFAPMPILASEVWKA